MDTSPAANLRRHMELKNEAKNLEKALSDSRRCQEEVKDLQDKIRDMQDKLRDKEKELKGPIGIC